MIDRNSIRKKAYKQSHEIALAIKTLADFLDENREHFNHERNENHFTDIELQHYGQRFFEMGEIYNKREADA